jgi:hypothetical protein
LDSQQSKAWRLAASQKGAKLIVKTHWILDQHGVPHQVTDAEFKIRRRIACGFWLLYAALLAGAAL